MASGEQDDDESDDGVSEFDDYRTPVAKNMCPHCGHEGMTRVSDHFPAPANKEAARRDWPKLCVATQSRSWEWCYWADRLIT